MNKKTFYFIFTLIFSIILLFSFSNYSFCSDPKLVSTIQKAFEEVEKWIMKIATPIAAVSVASGFLMQKFSFGDEEKIRTGKKLVRNSLISYAFILAIDLVLAAVKVLLVNTLRRFYVKYRNNRNYNANY